MQGIRSIWLRVRLIGSIALTLAAASGPPLTGGCAKDSAGLPGSCCKVCTTGKACGDTCIAQSATYHVGSGCACNG